mmetsp:Transcript_47668/g.79089  ORF Transcript_47668/g.79089 Transcript_47668/m.79089 type:complete len:165 (+) Transcript_47668:2-496(+)
MKEKHVRANVLNIIDRDKFVLHEEKDENVNAKNPKTTYKVSLAKDDVRLRLSRMMMRNAVSGDENAMDEKESDEKDVTHLELLDTVHVKETSAAGDKDSGVDAPHRDWSVLAKHLKDSSKEQARRKQILKQLERILHVREGLDVGLDQLQNIYNKQQTSKIEPK